MFVLVSDYLFIVMFLQHRMRPEIAQLLTPHIYSELKNHPSVLEYDSIKVHIILFPFILPVGISLLLIDCIL